LIFFFERYIPIFNKIIEIKANKMLICFKIALFPSH
jgi:hypothetical protein